MGKYDRRRTTSIQKKARRIYKYMERDIFFYVI
jgi:hypothetical protein